MIDEGSKGVLTEYILEEKRIQEGIGKVEDQLEAPLEKLKKAKAIVLRAKAALEAAWAEVKPLQSQKILLEGELELIQDKKREARIQARVTEVGGIRPGTSEFVEQMNELAGDPEEARIKEATKALDVDAALADLKSQMDD